MIHTEYLDAHSLKNHERNPRRIDVDDFERLKDSIRDNPEYFEVRPILCTPDLVVFAGNMRLKAALSLGLQKVPVAVMDISEEKQKELMIRDNVTNGRWDTDILGADFGLTELSAWGYDIDNLGTPSFAPSKPDTKLDETQRWIYVCPECSMEHIFTKKDLKPYTEEI